MNVRRWLVLLSALSVLAGCGGEPAVSDKTPPAPQPTEAAAKADDASHHEIAWFDGSVDEAFAQAKREGKPLFLYWGASWCPPCNQIKATIFSRPEFIEKSHMFVPVYLDGDSERAQQQGEQFGVMGYPTMIVFSPEGRELTRIPGGIDIELYAEALDLTLEGVRPVADTVAALMAGEEVGPDGYQLLSLYSWGQDNEQALEDYDLVEVLRRAAEGCPEEMIVARARIYGEYLVTALRGQDEEEPGLTPEEKAEARGRIAEVLDDALLSRLNLHMVAYYAGTLLEGVTEEGSPERDELKARWLERLDALEEDENVSIDNRLYVVLARVSFAGLGAEEDAPLPDDIVELVRTRVAEADAAAKTPYQRQSVINVAAYLLDRAGLREEAEKLLLAELEKSEQPYYFMLDLADIAQEDGRTEEAISWLRKAYETSEGSATRLQWGYVMVSGLLEMTPEDGASIQAAALQVLEEVDPDDVYGRSARTLKRLGTRLAEWNEDGSRTEHVDAIRARVEELCGAAEESPPACEEFLEAV